MHAVQRRAPTGGPRIYSFTISANFMALQVFAYRRTEGDLAQVANATKPERLIQVYPNRDAGDWMSWPPAVTIDDDALAVLDDRFVNVLSKGR